MLINLTMEHISTLNPSYANYWNKRVFGRLPDYQQKWFSGNFQRLTVKWGIKWTFNPHIWKVFHGLSIDVLHDQKDFLQYFGWLSPPRPMGVQSATPRPIFFHNMKILVRTNVHVENQLLILFGVDMLPWKKQL